MNDKEYMRLALQLAKKGCGWTSPNPMVGAVVVKEGRIIGQGWHQRYGQAHAERNALASCTEDPQGATLYVTLEPCCHYGKQPPCVDAILDAGIHRVVVGSADPNPLVAGKGIAILRAHGIDVTENVLQEECDALNKVFFHYITTKRPFVSMKYAMTMDGKIATYTGASKWITGEIARNHVQRQRHRFRGIMVGVGTILADDPLLTCRIEGGRDPVRIICDTHLRTPLQSQVVMTAKQVPTILATCCGDPEKQAAYQQAGCRVLCLEAHCGHVNLLQLMEQLGQELGKGTDRLKQKIAARVERRIQRAYPAAARQEPTTSAEKAMSVSDLVWLFVVGAFLGDVVETLFCRITAGVWLCRSSLVWGPFSVVWGLALVLAAVLLRGSEHLSERRIFWFGVILGGAYEYVCSAVTELLFGTVFWDYSKFKFNLGGRINLLYCFFWGIAAVLWMRYGYPLVLRLMKKVRSHIRPGMTAVLAVLMAVNMLTSALALARYDARTSGEAPNGQLEVFLDEHFDNARMENIYPNAKKVTKAE